MQKDDVIYRQAAIDVIKRLMGDSEFSRTVQTGLHILPPAQSERKMGKWIQNDNGTYSCSLCHSWIPEEQHYYARYCLYCGADMRGEKI